VPVKVASVLLLIVWIAVAVLAVVVLGGIAYGVLGAAARLRKEVAGATADLRPVLADVQATRAAAERGRQQRSGPG
jgi:hypothetical protein